jgi:hypothetical protein
MSDRPEATERCPPRKHLVDAAFGMGYNVRARQCRTSSHQLHFETAPRVIGPALASMSERGAFRFCGSAIMAGKASDLRERYGSKYERRGDDECWPWTAPLHRGRATIGVNGKMVLAHRVAWELEFGSIPKCSPDGRVYVCHNCDNRLCQNPRHLFLGSRADNVRGTAYRFWEKVDVLGPDECWPWTGQVDHKGYGRLFVKRRSVLVSRISWQLAYGPIPDGTGYHGTCICHKCDNRLCVNPAHLFAGSCGDNIRDAVAKGRFVRGERCHTSKLTEEQVRHVLRHREINNSDMARILGVTNENVSVIRLRQTWKHLQPDADGNW